MYGCVHFDTTQSRVIMKNSAERYPDGFWPPIVGRFTNIELIEKNGFLEMVRRLVIYNGYDMCDTEILRRMAKAAALDGRDCPQLLWVDMKLDQEPTDMDICMDWLESRKISAVSIGTALAKRLPNVQQLSITGYYTGNVRMPLYSTLVCHYYGQLTEYINDHPMQLPESYAPINLERLRYVVKPISMVSLPCFYSRNLRSLNLTTHEEVPIARLFQVDADTNTLSFDRLESFTLRSSGHLHSGSTQQHERPSGADSVMLQLPSLRGIFWPSVTELEVPIQVPIALMLDALPNMPRLVSLRLQAEFDTQSAVTSMAKQLCELRQNHQLLLMSELRRISIHARSPANLDPLVAACQELRWYLPKHTDLRIHTCC
ncbi:hypothetical protein LPJ61_003014 [Coemansia biformis]|uniref:Uncharacterized protein n=1 Tax=Coemansia biformis TaxID=1286918 RepID=A0A9W8CY39_9FUNG|nr:hypothetical protein LPJ61_003014 [Coemansia biformis]